MAVRVPSPSTKQVPTAPRPDARAAAIFAFEDQGRSRRGLLRRRAPAVLIASIIVIILVAVLATRALGAGTTNYQLATATTRDVASTWSGVASIEPTSQASVTFPVSGTVNTVDVREGDTVEAGQTLATLDQTALNETVHQKEAALAQAKLTLSRALNGEDVSGAGAPTGTGGSATLTSFTVGASPSSGAPSGSGGTDDAQLAQAQQAVLQAQQQVDAALADATTALASANTVCAAGGTTQQSGGQDGATAASDVTACQSALQAVLAQQQAVSQAQTNLANASRSLDDLLQQRVASSAGSTGSTGSTGGSSRSAPTTPSSPSNSSPSSADLAKYQAAVDSAAAEVVAAQQATNQATIVSPIAGTVVVVDLAVGDEVSSGSTTAHIEIVGSGGYEATTTAGVDDIAHVKVGQPATVVPDGVGRSIPGRVVAISVSPVEGASSTTYRVTIALQGRTDDLRIGSTGSVAIVTQRAQHATAVPTSAVTVGANRSTVQVLDGSDAKTVTVTVGVIGDTWTQITDGVTKGQRVVLANLDEPLPSSATDASNGTQQRGNLRLPGGFPGGGGFPGR
jgi:HlyD family secretion protein